MLTFIKEQIYNFGFRPKVGSIFFSPSLDLLYAFIDANEEVRKYYSSDH